MLSRVFTIGSLSFASVLAFVVVGCSSSSSSPASAVGGGDAGAGGDDAASGAEAGAPYPAGPYGLDVGSVVGDFGAQGFAFTPTATDYTKLTLAPLSVAKVRAATPGCRCMLVSVVAGWCQPANAEQSVIKSALAAHPEMCAFETLEQGTTPGTTSNEADLDAWASAHAPTFPVVLANDTGAKLLGRDVPFDLMVRTDTMTIVAQSPTPGSAMSADDVASLLAACTK